MAENKLLINNESALWVFIPIMGVLALVGVVLAGTSLESFYQYAGYALFAISVLSIFLNLKSYYDAQDRRSH